jgi:hypothetical protein
MNTEQRVKRILARAKRGPAHYAKVKQFAFDRYETAAYLSNMEDCDLEQRYIALKWAQIWYAGGHMAATLGPRYAQWVPHA